MRSAMDIKTFLAFYKNTILGYSNSLQNHICRLLEAENRITFEEQRSLMDTEDTLYFESKKDYKGIIVKTASDIKFANFYEKWEFIKLYKYSVPLFFETKENKSIEKILNDKKIQYFNEREFVPKMILNTSLKDTEPLYWNNNEQVFIKFVLQKTYVVPETFDQIDYRFPVVVYIDSKNSLLEIRYDSAKYNSQFYNEAYEKLVTDCINWLTQELDIEIFLCKHSDTISVINDKQDDTVKMYKQMMEMSSGGSAELTASESADYVLPFVGEIRSLIEENEELFNQAEEVKQLLLQYLGDKEATASYPYIYIKWVKAVESQSYIVRVTFDYLNHRHTLLQHITGECKDLGMERMNDAIKYLCESGAFVKGEKFNIDCDALFAFLSRYHKNDWIYPDALHRNLKIDIKMIYEILEICVENNILEQYLQIYCPRCQRFIGSYYKTVFDIPSEVNCIHCGEDIEQPLKHAIIIYRVL